MKRERNNLGLKDLNNSCYGKKSRAGTRLFRRENRLELHGDATVNGAAHARDGVPV
jgi:hypothetical protein